MNTRQICSLLGLTLLGTVIAAPALHAADTPMGGGYANVIPIPVSDPATKAIAGALFKPEGPGPFPVVVYIPPCGGPNFPLELQQEKRWIDMLNAKGVATLIVDPFVPRGLQQGNCETLLTVLADVQDKKKSVLEILKRGSDDAVAAVKVAKAMPDIDPKKVFLIGFSYGATAVLSASNPKTPGEHDADVAGVIAYYPLCDAKAEAAAPTLILIGDKDDWTGPLSACEALKGKSNYDVVVYPGATHAFTLQFDAPVEFAGHKMAYDEAATKDSAQRAVDFVTMHLK